MIKIATMVLTLFIVACDVSHEPVSLDKSIQSTAVVGEIAPDIFFRGSFIAQSGGICALVLIEAGQLAKDASIRFNSSLDPPGFEASDGIRSDCIKGQVTFIDMVTGEAQTIPAPVSLEEAQTFSRYQIKSFVSGLPGLAMTFKGFGGS